MPILVDFTQVAIAACFPFQNDLKITSNADKKENLIRHVILNSLLSSKKKWHKEYGQLVICTDDKNYWRKDIFPYYKASRKKNREKSTLDWNFIFNTISLMRDDLIEYFPYRVVNNSKTEADDIIGTLTMYLHESKDTKEGLLEEPQKIMILSSDQDHLQLQEYHGVKQYSPMQKKFVKAEHSPHKSLIEKICTGDPGDGIPNILSDDDIFVTDGKRQRPFRKTRLEEFYKYGIDACANETERRNYSRNEAIISYKKIPLNIRGEIIDKYNLSDTKNNKKTIMNYLMKHNCRLLMKEIENF